MAGLIKVSADPGQLRDLEAILFGLKHGPQRVITVAVNRTLTTGRGQIVKRLAKELNLNQKTIRAFIDIRKANWDTLSGAIVLRHKGIPLYKFAPVPNKPGHTDAPGVSVEVRRGRGREMLRSTFIATMKSTHTGVFERIGRPVKPTQGRYAGKVYSRGRLKGKPILRQPIVERFGPAPLGVFKNAPGIADEIYATLEHELAKNIESQTDRLLNPRTNDLTRGDSKGGAEDAS